MRKYEDLNRIHENTMAPRAHYIPYDSLEKALGGEKGDSAYYRLLNGEWEFAYFASLEELHSTKDIAFVDCNIF